MDDSTFDENAPVPAREDDRELADLDDPDAEPDALLRDLLPTLRAQLVAAGLPVDDPVALAGADPELRAAWLRVVDAARRAGSDDPEAQDEVRDALGDVAVLREAILPTGVREGSGIAIEDGAADAYAADTRASAEGETEPDDER